MYVNTYVHTQCIVSTSNGINSFLTGIHLFHVQNYKENALIATNNSWELASTSLMLCWLIRRLAFTVMSL